MPLEPALANLARLLPRGTQLQTTQAGHREAVVGTWNGLRMASAFQPWRLTTSQEIVAVEAYVRAVSGEGQECSPWTLLAQAENHGQLVELDRLCRTVHALNHFTVGLAKTPLVLNVDARLLHAVAGGHGTFFGGVLDILRLSARQIVIEVRTSQLLDLSALQQAIASYRHRGFQVAVNAEGAIHALTLARLLTPDVLMLQAGLLQPIALNTLVSAARDCGVQVAVKHVETEQQLQAARYAGVSWVQGLLLDRPGP